MRFNNPTFFFCRQSLIILIVKHNFNIKKRLLCIVCFSFILFFFFPFLRVKGTELDLFDPNSYNTLDSISEVLDLVCTCQRHGPNDRTGDIECNYGTYKNCKFVVGKPFYCILNPEGQLRRKRDLRHLESIFSNVQIKNKPVRLFRSPN